MNHLRQLCAIVVLTLVLTFAAFAGEMDTPGIATTPPPSQPVSVTGDMQTGASVSSDNECATTDAVVEFALGLMRGAMSLF